ncbi:MAG TPA: biotin carboxylase N-terminal domain-containing protein [Beutenbergiaceae bacterium]|nr:biotin carboxylase N-terminal domain-containing protein [Beutenbergiaceae bacterium]
MTELFTSVLVAGRGEIAVRIIDTLHRMGNASVAVYTEEDHGAAHTEAAARAVRIGSYLDGAGIQAAALGAGAQAIHPGYGFLAENASFARACAAAGLTFIGPSPEAIETMGDKIAARAAVAARGVATVPGVADPELDDAALIDAAGQLGFPVLIKPAAGGGGKGIRRVESPEDLPSALAGARREAAGAFGDDTVFLERFITGPRHIEVQILADAHGHYLHLGERECSLQRRHQKVVEEAPSPLLSDDQRAIYGQAAIATARAVDYVGAGTVEFIVSAAAPQEPFFMEMNTRLQVEHAVTEAVTGIDLVAEQVRIAAGAPLQINQDDVALDGHAIEARIYAEDPDADFLPTGGTVLDLALPTGPGVRIDHALRVGAHIGTSYDPMLAKVITHGASREQALAKLDRALAATHVLGVGTNTASLRRLLAHDQVAAGDLDTGLIERLVDQLRRPAPSAQDYAVAALVRWQDLYDRAPAGLWHSPSGWRLGEQAGLTVPFAAPGGEAVRIVLTGSPQQARAQVNGTEFTLALAPGAVTIADEHRPLLWHSAEHTVWISTPGGDREFTIHTPARRAGTAAGTPALDAPMPGTVIDVLAAAGEQVQAGDPVVAIEAMKMEHLLRAPTTGTVHLWVHTGQKVRRGQQLAVVDNEESDEHRP